MKVIVSVCVLLSAVLVFTQGKALKNAYGHDIIEGNCNKTNINDRVFYDHVLKTGFPFVVRSETEEYSGNKSIYCIQALNQKSVETGGNAYLTKGGVNLTFVTIELESFRGHGLEFYVSIYARNGTNATILL